MKNTIYIGSDAEYREVYCRGAFAVYRKTLETSTSFVVAKIPGTVRAGDPPAVPTSVCSEFGSEAKARTALDKWASAPVPPKMLKRLDEPGTRKTASGLNFHSKKVGPGQMDLALTD